MEKGLLMTVTVWILGDQLLKEHPALAQAEQNRSRQEVVVLMIESQAQLRRMPYHAKKIALLLSAMCHYAETLRTAGFRVDYRTADSTSKAILDHLQAFRPDNFFMMEASIRRG